MNEANRSPKHAPESPPPAWEFSHPRFLRGRPELLADIRRRVRTRSAALWNPVSVAANLGLALIARWRPPPPPADRREQRVAIAV